MARRPLPTGPADWLILAVTPALLMGMVSALLFFILAVFYRGEFNERLHWILFAGVVGMVLIGRIHLIDEIARRASLYSGILGLLVAIALIRFVPPPTGWPVAGHYAFCAILVAIGFWATRLLVADTTDIHSESRIDGEGLLRAAGMEDDPAARLRREVERRTVGEENPRRVKGPGKKGTPAKAEGDADAEEDAGPADPHRRKTPGVTIVWFSALALPVFGIGQAFIPAEEVKTRWYTLMLLVGYLGCAFLLLLTSCFLGFRRYLARRGLSMPATMSAVWILGGMLLVGCVLVGAMLIPRPSDIGPLQTLSALVGKKIEPLRREPPRPEEAVKRNQQKIGQRMEDQPGSDKGREESSPDGKKDASQPQKGDKGSTKGTQKDSPTGDSKGKGQNDKAQGRQGDGKARNAEAGNSKGKDSGPGKGEKDAQTKSGQAQGTPGDPRTGDKKKGELTSGKEPENKSGKAESREPVQPPPPPAASSVSQWMESLRKLGLFVVTGLAIGLVVAFALTCMATGWSPPETISRWIAWLNSFFRRKEGEDRWSPASPGGPEEDAPLPAFADMPDPFEGRRPLPERELVRLTFRAIQAWGSDAGDPMLQGETPNEYFRRLASLHPVAEEGLVEFCGWHDLAEYSREAPLDGCRDSVRELWACLRNGARGVAASSRGQ
jgi:hypothetical protein